MSRKRPLMDDSNRWSEHLPDELIEMIVKRLTLADSIRFAAVCPSWRSVSSHWFRRVSRLPWLLKSINFLDSETVKYSLYSPSEDTVYDLKFPRGSASRSSINSMRICCTGSIDGWLIMSEWSAERCSPWDARMSIINYLLNPMTGDRIKLPQLTGIIPRISTASSDPRSSDCIVAIAQSSELVFCRPGSHHSCLWKDKHIFDIQFVKFHEDGKLYAIERVNNNTTELQIVVLVLDSVRVTNPLDQCDREGKCKGKCEKIIAHKIKTIAAGSAPRASYDLLINSTPSIFWFSKGEFLLVRTRIFFPQAPAKQPEFAVHYVLKTDDTSGGNPIWVNAMNEIAEDQVLFLSTEPSTLMSKPAKGCMPTIDECFFALHRGKLFTHYWNEGTILIARGVWFTPNIIKSC